MNPIGPPSALPVGGNTAPPWLITPQYQGEPPPPPPGHVPGPIDAFLAAGGLPGRFHLQTLFLEAGIASGAIPGDEGDGLAPSLGERAAPPPPPREGVGVALPPGVSEAPSSLIHERKTGSACDTTTYEPISARADRYGKHRQRALQMADFCGGEQPHRADKLRGCGAFLQFRNYFTLGQVRLTAGHFCQQDKLCGLCACRRGGRYLRAYVEKTQAVLAEQKLTPYLVTLTVKDGADLGERVQHLLSSHRKLMDHRRDALKNRSRGYDSAETAATCAVGGVGSCEVKRGKNSGLWHPHWHAIWLCDQPPSAAALSAEWLMITGDSHVVDVRPFDFVAESSDAGDGATWEQMAGDFCEVFKYALKLGDLALQDNWDAFLQLQRKRMIEPFGCLRGVEVPEDLKDAPLAPDLPFIEILLGFHGGRYHMTGTTRHDFDPTKLCRWPRPFSD